MIPKGLEYLKTLKKSSNKDLRETLIERLKRMPINGVLSFSHREEIKEIARILFELIIEDYFENNFDFSIQVNGTYTKVKKLNNRNKKG